MKPALRQQYDSTRDFSQKKFASACYAPFTSLYFDTLGTVRVCCHNVAHKVGDILRENIDAIWNGEKLKEIRKALAQYDFSCGCQFCEWRVSLGSVSSLTMKGWDRFPVEDFSPSWPQMMEFSLSNTCNLECIMCIGHSSSAIRAHREHLPPLKAAYGDEFFIDLRKYLPHLTRAKFLGGEPFLQKECFRIWDMMIQDGLSVPCHVTTNGTQWNERIERLLTRLPFDISVSMDGFTKATVEGIRVNAVHERVLDHFYAFHYYARSINTGISLTYCLMRSNWQEFGDFCAFADEWDCPVFVNTVRRPPHLSLFTLPCQDLAKIVDLLEKQSASLLPVLKKNGPVWLGELQRLESVVRTSPSAGVLNILPDA